MTFIFLTSFTYDQWLFQYSLGALVLDGIANDRAVLFAEPSRALDVKFSSTAVAWVKYPSTLATRTCILAFRYTYDTGK